MRNHKRTRRFVPVHYTKGFGSPLSLFLGRIPLGPRGRQNVELAVTKGHLRHTRFSFRSILCSFSPFVFGFNVKTPTQMAQYGVRGPLLPLSGLRLRFCTPGRSKPLCSRRPFAIDQDTRSKGGYLYTYVTMQCLSRAPCFIGYHTIVALISYAHVYPFLYFLLCWERLRDLFCSHKIHHLICAYRRMVY